MMEKKLQSILSRLSVSSSLRKIETMQKQKDQVMQPVTMAILIAIIVILSELPSFSSLTNSSSPSVILGKPVSLLVAKTLSKMDKVRPSNFIKIPVHRNHGFYYVQIKIGNPPKRYKLDIDTGSDLTWLPKGRYPLYESQSIRYVKCKNSAKCFYEIGYKDGVSSTGLLVTDTFTLQLKGGSPITPTLVIGSGAYHSPSTGSNSYSTTHGMLGLGKGETSILSQLHQNHHFANIFGHCLNSSRGVSGFMFIGSDFDYPRCLTWVPMSSDVPHYSLTMAQVVYGDEKLLVWNHDFVLDSGTTYTYFIDPLYKQLLAKIAEMALQKVPGDYEHPDCWRDTRPFKSILHLRNRFRSLYLKLENGRALEIPPENYLIIMEDGDACLAIINGFTKGLNDFNLIGVISMQNVMIVYDNEQQKIGWARVAGCSNP